MRLGDASNFSHGRTSASTLDDAFSGRADAASSMTSESENESDAIEQPILPPTRVPVKAESASSHPNGCSKKQRKHLREVLPSIDSTELSGDERDADYDEGTFRSNLDDHIAYSGNGGSSKPARGKSAAHTTHKVRTGSDSIKTFKSSKAVTGITRKSRPSSLSTNAQAPVSPASLPSQSRKTSSASTINFQHQLGVDEDDLSSKPRCQRCRKSKKGCDRQRPCQRCKDAGIGVEGCVSEDEGNGRKGRYGRHMGVPVKKGSDGYILDESENAGAILTEMAGIQAGPEKSKKRKR